MMLKQFLGDADPARPGGGRRHDRRHREPEQPRTLMELAQSQTDTDVRREAVEALADRASGAGTSSTRRAIIELLSTLATTDRDADVQVEAVETLGEIGGAAAVAELRKLARHASGRARASRSHRVAGRERRVRRPRPRRS